ncbi:hypothetical protein G6F46_002906 [Rhizopus delemar]|uniref:Uncharacterized protein n=2 Tax=Rhizopus TaxID=4842 RepID=A0A9P6YZR4_9FUNG|nr:hypothetical protein G6F36_012718 [Rhizopus arrhizus]KAG1464323.1 hypothetical protein G6F55_001856 [Rhizopus delemar]KAG1502407.1 hypothetical protein G6F54_002380 [Rhizopus delemar]KAG1516635.1 hypothetical protein G6F53_001999 [Rhizopus delemar]KAG1524051.1 hypothetical protein G6F52_004518 [Rhizopus delemar]
MEGPKHSADTMTRHLKSAFSRETTLETQRYNISSDSLPFELADPITLPDIISTTQSHPSNKAPIVDHWPYVPESWRVAQVVPIHKKGTLKDTGRFMALCLRTVL